MDEKRYIFAGNRGFVLDEMRRAGLNIKGVAAYQGSWLEQQLRSDNAAFESFSSKKELIEFISQCDFDVFVSNGCPFIIPVSSLCKPRQLFINIHPSPLPDLRGKDPVPGALLLGRDSGAACHVMDDGIDSGPVISRVVIPYSVDLDAPLLYQLSFMAEKEVFKAGLERKFVPIDDLNPDGSEIYYSALANDRILDLSADISVIIRQIRAFANKSQGVSFAIKGMSFKCFDGDEISNVYLMSKINEYKENEIVFKYEDTLIVRKNNSFLRLKRLEGNVSEIKTGDRLETLS